MKRSLQFPILLHSKPYARSVLCYFAHKHIGFITGISLKKPQTNKKPTKPSAKQPRLRQRGGFLQQRGWLREAEGAGLDWEPGAVPRPGAERGAAEHVVHPHPLQTPFVLSRYLHEGMQITQSKKISLGK